jgi:hypothetical protein
MRTPEGAAHLSGAGMMALPKGPREARRRRLQRMISPLRVKAAPERETVSTT